MCGAPSPALGAEVAESDGDTGEPGDSPLDDALRVLANDFDEDESEQSSPAQEEQASPQDDDDEPAAGVVLT